MSRLHMLWGRLRMRSMGHVLQRVQHILKSYGFTAKQFSRTLEQYVATVQEYGITPTLPVPATVVDKHPQLFQEIQQVGVRFAIHGYQHIDYTRIQAEEVKAHLDSAIDVFEKANIKWSGFRFPFLRYDEERLQLLANTGFSWDSSRVISWSSLEFDEFSDERWKSYQTILDTYQAIDSKTTYTLPEMRGNLVEIPVSVPDDDILIERLGIHDKDQLQDIWLKILSRVRDDESMFIAQLHPERFSMFQEALKGVLQAVQGNDDVWTASMDDISKWWRDKETFRFEVKRKRKNMYSITAHCDARTTVLVRSDAMVGNRVNIWNDAVKMDARSWEMESSTKPIIGVHPKSVEKIGPFLRGEGFAFELAEKPQDYSFYVNQKKLFDYTEKKVLLDSINKSTKPLIRFWRWPDQSKYCLSITGDIDCVTVGDFWERLNG